MAARIVQVLWGLPQTIVGLVVLFVTRKCSRERFRTAVVTHWPLDSGLSLGMFVFVPSGCSRKLIVHEYGHCIQSLILGPLYLPVIALPSILWAGIPALGRWRHNRCLSYYSFFTERWANWLGERVCHESSMGQALVD